MKFLYTKEKAKDLKAQLNIQGEGGNTDQDFEIAADTQTFQEALQSAITNPEVLND